MTPSRTPRRAFAAPLVMTIAALPACVVASSKPGTGNQPEPHVRDHRAGADGDKTATKTHENPPRPTSVDHTQTADPGTTTKTPESTAPDHDRSWTVSMAKDGTCSAMGETSCPANAKCNPPPPTVVACPSNVTVDKPVKVWASAGSNDCYVNLDAGKCPAKATCNPPPPQKTACPQ